MKVSKLLVSSLLCGTLLTSPVAKANLLADICKYFSIGTVIYVSYRAVKAAAEATGNGEFQSAVDEVGDAATGACSAVVKFGATVADSAGKLVKLAVDKTAETIKGKKNLGEENLDGKNSIEHQIIFVKKDDNINNGDENQIISNTPNN